MANSVFVMGGPIALLNWHSLKQCWKYYVYFVLYTKSWCGFFSFTFLKQYVID